MINRDYDSPRFRDDTGKVKLWEALKIAAFYLFCFAATVYAINLYSYVGQLVAYAVIAGIIASLISWKLVPPERPNQIIALKRNLSIYAVTLIGAYFLITNLNSLDSNTLAVSLGLSTGQTTNNAALGWVQMMLQFLMIGTPITHVLFEVKRVWTFYGFGFGKDTKRKTMEKRQKVIVTRK